MPTLPASGYPVPTAPSVAPLEDLPDRGGYQDIRAPAGAFGAGMAEGMQAFGQDAAKAAEHVTNIQSFYDQIASDEKVNQVEDKINKKLYGDPSVPGDVGYLGLQGDQAMNSRDATRKAIDSILLEHRSAVGNLNQQHMFDQQTRRYRNTALQQIGQHYDREFNKWTTATYENKAKLGVAAAQRAANQNDFGGFQEALGTTLTGLDTSMRVAGKPEAEIDNVRNVVTQGLAAAWARNQIVLNPVEAARFIDQNKDHLGDQYDNLLAAARAKARDIEVDSYISGTPLPSGPVNRISAPPAVPAPASAAPAPGAAAAPSPSGGGVPAAAPDTAIPMPPSDDPPATPDAAVPGLLQRWQEVAKRLEAAGRTDLLKPAAERLRRDMNAAYTDQQHRRQEIERVQKEVVKTGENDVIADAFSAAPKITAQDISVDKRFDSDPEARMRMLALKTRLAEKPLVDPVVSATTMHELMRGIAAGDVDRPQIIDAFNAKPSHLNEAHFNFLLKQLDDVRTPEGLKIAKDIDKLLQSAKGSITKSNPLMGDPDASGDLQFGAFEEDVRNAVEGMKRDKKSPAEISEWLSVKRFRDNPALLEPYQKTLQQSIQDQARTLSRPPVPPPAAAPAPAGAVLPPRPGAPVFTAPIPPVLPNAPAGVLPRLPGESAADYMRRSGR